MPSTYTLNNGIELIATGEQSGTWGDTTNVNLGLIDTALDGQVTITLPAAGSFWFAQCAGHQRRLGVRRPQSLDHL
jgi:hypothetical protein